MSNEPVRQSITIPAEAFIDLAAIDLTKLTFEQWKAIKHAQWSRTYAAGAEQDTEWKKFLAARPVN